MKRITTLVGYRVETYGLTEELHDIVVVMVENGKSTFGNYSLEEIDEDMLDSWIENAQDDGDTEYENFLTNAKREGAEMLCLEDWLGDAHQTIGDVAIYH